MAIVYQTVKFNRYGDGKRPLRAIDRDSEQHAAITAEERNAAERDLRFYWTVRIKPR